MGTEQLTAILYLFCTGQPILGSAAAAIATRAHFAHILPLVNNFRAVRFSLCHKTCHTF
jgi:hypothetical protein